MDPSGTTWEDFAGIAGRGLRVSAGMTRGLPGERADVTIFRTSRSDQIAAFVLRAPFYADDDPRSSSSYSSYSTREKAMDYVRDVIGGRILRQETLKAFFSSRENALRMVGKGASTRAGKVELGVSITPTQLVVVRTLPIGSQ